MPFSNLIQGYFVPSSITCVNSMEVSYVPIAKARGFTTHWITAPQFIKGSLHSRIRCQISFPCLIDILNIAFYNRTKKPSSIYGKKTLNRKESFPWDDL